MTQCRTMLSQRPCGIAQCERPECTSKGSNAGDSPIKFQKGNKVRILWKGKYKTGVVVSWNQHYKGWEICITSKFDRGAFLIFPSVALELQK